MTIENYITLSVTDCKRQGFFAPAKIVLHGIRWTNGAGQQVAAITMLTDTRTEPVAILSYSYGGEPRTETIQLRFKHSNLTPDTPNGYYYFVCPVTGVRCRKLYLVDGRFVGRKAFKALYKKQTYSHKERRGGLLASLIMLSDIEDKLFQPYRRETYRGKLTPYGRRARKLLRQYKRIISCGE